MKNTNTLTQILLTSLSIMLVISSVALLHANESEFILDRFSNITDLKFSLFDTLLYIAYLIGGLVIGALAASAGKRKIFILTGTVVTACLTLTLTFVKSYPLLLTLRFFQGLFCVAAWQTLMTLILDLSDESNRGRNMGIFGFFMALGMGLSPMIGGFLAKVSLFVPYYVASAQNLLAFLIALFLIKDVTVTQKSQKPSVSAIFKFAFTRKKLFVPAMFNFVDRLHMGFIIFIIPLMLKEVLQLGPEYRGMLLGINGSAFILLQYPIGRLSDKFGRFGFLITGSIGYGILLAITGFVATAGLVPLIIVFFILGIFSGLTGPPNNAFVGDLVEPNENPLAMGLFNFFGNLGMICGPLFAGIILSFANYKTAFISAGALELFVLGCCLLVLKIMDSSFKLQRVDNV